jgi:hypothetical protein
LTGSALLYQCYRQTCCIFEGHGSGCRLMCPGCNLSSQHRCQGRPTCPPCPAGDNLPAATGMFSGSRQTYFNTVPGTSWMLNRPSHTCTTAQHASPCLTSLAAGSVQGMSWVHQLRGLLSAQKVVVCCILCLRPQWLKCSPLGPPDGTVGMGLLVGMVLIVPGAKELCETRESLDC